MAYIEYLQGKEQHTSNWGKVWVKGLEEYVCKEDHDGNRNSNHYQFQCYVGCDIPAGAMFSIFIQDGTKRGTDTFEFYICMATPQTESDILHRYTGCFVKGDFEIIASATTKTKAPRLMEWWNNHEQTLETAQRCAKYIDKRGQKLLPAE